MSAPALKLVLLPGMHGTEEMFAAFQAALPAGFKTVALRYPTDRKLSYAELEAMVWSATPEGPYLFVAESFSTPLAIQCAAKAPPGLVGLVLCVGFASSPARGWRRWLSYLLSPVIFAKTMSATMVRYMLAGPNASAEFVKAVRQCIAAVRPAVMAARYRAVLGCDMRAELKAITLPILYLQAAEDNLIPPACLEEIRRIKPEITSVSITAPHLLLETKPEKCVDEILKFIQQNKLGG